MARDVLGGVPFEVRKERGKVSIRFFPEEPQGKKP